MSVTQFTAVTLHFKSAAAQEYSIMPKKQEVNMAKVTTVYFVCATEVRSQLLSFADFFFYLLDHLGANSRCVANF